MRIVIALFVACGAFAALRQAPDPAAAVRAYVYTATSAASDHADQQGRVDAVRDVREALAKKKGITLVDDREQATLLVEVLGREQREDGAGAFGGKSITRMGDTIIRLRVKAGDEESDLKGMGQGTWGRAAKDAADRISKWLARNRKSQTADCRLPIDGLAIADC